ncbi:hypothetical protein JCM30237_17930 [Halolamina litorea]|uniref:Uncharacterized protein n=1 Tax=Halolamina litorea TaxID=1515593 RepID=A0ABD6BR81_9EURY|nr:hypothetical protein [Halolamina litorea]
MTRTTRARRTLAGAAALLLALLAVGLARARRRGSEVPLSPITADWYVGPNFVERRGIHTGDEPAGEVDDTAHFAGESFDPTRLHPEVRRFYERTADYEMRYRATWHRPFRTGAAAASHLTSRVEQLNLPGPGEEDWHRLESRFLDVAEPGSVTIDADPDEPAREDVRAWVRTDPETAEAVFVALYATHHRDGEGFVNISVPVPVGGVDTVLRPEHLAIDASDDDDRTGIRLTTESAGDPGLYLRTPLGAFEAPAGQTFEVWPAEGDDDADLRATHEMWLAGATFLTVEYEIERA